MNVFWFSHLVPYPATGLGVLQRSYNLLRELARAHQVHLVAFVQKKIVEHLQGDLEAGLAEARAHLGSFCASVQFASIPSEQQRYGQHLLAARSLFTRDPYTINWLKSPAARAVVAELGRRINFDVVHFDTLSLAPYRDLFAGHICTLDHHNIESHMMLRRAQIEAHPLKRLYFRQEGERLLRYERRVCREFDLNITCSPLDSRRLEEIVPGAVVTDIPNGVDTAYFQPDGTAIRPMSLVFAGNMSWYPNASAMQFFADEVWPSLKRALPGVQMNLVGDHAPASLRALAARDQDFRVHGFVPDVRTYLSAAAIYVCPILDGGGTKLKVLDALSMGKPLVAHPVACEGIDVRNGENVLFASTPEEFVNAIASLAASPARLQAMSTSARRLAESRYSYAGIGRKLCLQLEQLVERRPAAAVA